MPPTASGDVQSGPGLLNLIYIVSHYISTQCCAIPDSKVHGANMGPIWGRQDPGGPHVGPMNFVIWDVLSWWYYLQVSSLTLEQSYDALVSVIQHWKIWVKSLITKPQIANWDEPLSLNGCVLVNILIGFQRNAFSHPGACWCILWIVDLLNCNSILISSHMILNPR